MTRFVFFLALLWLAGCPEPAPEGNVGPAGASSGTPKGAPNGPEAGAGSPPTVGTSPDVGGNPAPSGGTAPQAAGTFGGDLSESELEPEYTQDQLADGGRVRGKLVCSDCQGKLLVRVLPPPPAGDEADHAKGTIRLITKRSFAGPGPYEIRVPKGQPVVLQVVDDANSDGKPSEGERMGMRLEGAITVTDQMDGVDLEVGVFPNMPEQPAAEAAGAAPSQGTKGPASTSGGPYPAGTPAEGGQTAETPGASSGG